MQLPRALCGSSSWLQSAWILSKASDALVAEWWSMIGTPAQLSGFIPLGELCGLIYAVAGQTRIKVWAAMVAAVLVSSPQKV